MNRVHDFIIIGAGISGSFLAHKLVEAGADCLMLEAGRRYTRQTYPRVDVDATSQLYWAGGLELSTDAKTVFLRPKCVGGGSIVNQALVDRFDDPALDSWRTASGVSFFTAQEMSPWYEAAETEISIETIDDSDRNENALIFEQGFRDRGYKLAPLRRAQKNCAVKEGNDCIVCLGGCARGAKQSTPETVLKKALLGGLKLIPGFDARELKLDREGAQVSGMDPIGHPASYRGRRLVLAAGAIGNTKLLWSSGFRKKLPALGQNFFCHPQYNNFAIYEKPIAAHRGSFQAFKSDDPGFRENGFKLENVYAPPPAIAMLISGFGRKHQKIMERLNHLACIEVCTRDTEPGRISLSRSGKVIVRKKPNPEDEARYQRGLKAINEIFRATGAKEIFNCPTAIGLHLMGGCGMGIDSTGSVVGPDFRVHEHPNIVVADSSIFPNAPGINPSLTIMALATKAAHEIIRGF